MLTISQLRELTTGQLTNLLEEINEVLAERDSSHPRLPPFTEESGSGYDGDIYDADARFGAGEPDLVGQN